MIYFQAYKRMNETSNHVQDDRRQPI